MHHYSKCNEIDDKDLDVAFSSQMLCERNLLIGCISQDSQLGEGFIVQVTRFLERVHNTPGHTHAGHSGPVVAQLTVR